jgi:hypothetical protein
VAKATYTISDSFDGTTTVLDTSVNPSTLDQPVTFTATVTTQSGATPTGSVSFLHGGTVMGTARLNGSGVASFTTSDLTAAQHGITATYTGSSANPGSTSRVVTEVVNP